MSYYTPAGMEEDNDDDEWDYVSSVEKTCKNMKITIVPDITKNAGIHGQSFDAKLEPDLIEWFNNFKHVWGIYKKCPTISNTLQLYYQTSPNPFLYSLKFFANSPDSDNPKKYSLSHTIIEELFIFKKNNKPNLLQFVDDNLKMVAFNFMVKQGQLLRLAVNTFDLINSKHLFVNKIKEMISNHMYKEACQNAYELELFEEFTVYEMIFPLILQDRKSIVEEYLERAVKLRAPLIELLDSLLIDGKSKSIVQKCDSYIAKYDYRDLKLHVINVKFLSRFITRIAKQYNIPNELTPNVNRLHNYGALQVLYYKKYIQKSLNNDSWTEMIKETVSKDSTDLHINLIDHCTDQQDYSEATKWTLYFNIPYDSLPSLLQEYILKKGYFHKSKEEGFQLPKDSLGKINEFHSLSLDNAALLIVDSKDKFHDMINHLKNQQILALDSEWKPFGMETTEVALIQIATTKKIFLIDVILVSIDQNDWADLGKYIFNNEEILKLGFALSTDLSMLQNTIPALNLQPSHGSYLDLQDLWKKLETIKKFKFPYFEEHLSSNLSNLVKLCIGKKLDKSNQFSNWENRPLRKDQISYAALDAFCLMEIYFVIENELKKIGVDLSELIMNLLMERKKNVIIKKKNKQLKVKTNELCYSTEINQIPRKVGDVKFVCNHMLEELGKKLRSLGFDTVIMCSSDQFDKCAEIARRDERYALTRGKSFCSLSQILPKNHCFDITCDLVEDQLIEVLNFYNICVANDEIFNRCMICNSDKFIKITKLQMLNLRTGGKFKVAFQKQESNIPISNDLNLTDTSSFLKKTTSSGSKIQVSVIPMSVINLFDNFIFCDDCGRIGYYDQNGKIQDILQLNYKNVIEKNFKSK